jgi:hypothetical protein
MHIVENVEGTFKETTVRKTYEDSYTLEMKELYAVMTNGKPIKTTAVDAREDLDTFKMILTEGRYTGQTNGVHNHK